MSLTALAMIGYPVGPIAFGGFFVLLIVAFLLTRRPSGKSSTQNSSPRDHGAALGCLSLISGPSIGAALAFWVCHTTDINPLDVGFTYRVFVGTGLFAGFIAGVAFAVASLAAGKPAGGSRGRVDPDF